MISLRAEGLLEQSNPGFVIVAMLAALGISLALAPRLGTEFFARVE